MLQRFLQSPQLNLLISSGYETWRTLNHFSLGAHHGVLIFSIIQILKTLPEFVEGTKKLTEAESAA